MTLLPSPQVPHPTTPQEALNLLMAGNGRYHTHHPHLDESPQRRAEVAGSQHPFAMVLGCVDSRVPPELIFDCGLGELFVVRTAGHVLDHAVLGSLEFGVEALQIPLLVVLGHDRCGAVKSTLQTLQDHTEAPQDIHWLTEHIRPAIEAVQDHSENLLNDAIKAHIRQTVQVLQDTPILKEAIAAGRLMVVGAKYHLESGRVHLQ